MIGIPKTRSMETMNIKVSCTRKIKKALKVKSRGKAGGADGLSIDLIKAACDFLLDKLTILSMKCL